MEGYVKNVSPLWKHAMKRSIGPGEKIPLDTLYEQYGVKHEMEQGKTFVDWLRQVKLKDSSVWEIRYKDSSTNVVSIASESKIKALDELEDMSAPAKDNTSQTPFVKSKATVSDLVNMSVRQARDILPKFTDQKLLKYALNECSQLAGKDTLNRMLRKRITELELSRR